MNGVINGCLCGYDKVLSRGIIKKKGNQDTIRVGSSLDVHARSSFKLGAASA